MKKKSLKDYENYKLRQGDTNEQMLSAKWRGEKRSRPGCHNPSICKTRNTCKVQ